MVTPLSAFLLGFIVGALVIGWAQSKPKPAPPRKPNPTAFFETLLGRKIPQAPAKRPDVTSIPRSAGSWRRQKAELERQHNSRQKERDQRVASI